MHSCQETHLSSKDVLLSTKMHYVGRGKKKKAETKSSICPQVRYKAQKKKML